MQLTSLDRHHPENLMKDGLFDQNKLGIDRILIDQAPQESRSVFRNYDHGLFQLKGNQSHFRQ